MKVLLHYRITFGVWPYMFICCLEETCDFLYVPSFLSPSGQIKCSALTESQEPRSYFFPLVLIFLQAFGSRMKNLSGHTLTNVALSRCLIKRSPAAKLAQPIDETFPFVSIHSILVCLPRDQVQNKEPVAPEAN
jgi:hypothetical protein